MAKQYEKPPKQELVEGVINTLVKQVNLLGDCVDFRVQAVTKIMAIFGEADRELPF